MKSGPTPRSSWVANPAFKRSRSFARTRSRSDSTSAIRCSSSREVRQALNRAIDRDAIVQAGFRGRARTAQGPVWPEHWASSDAVPRYLYNREAALLGFAAAGYGTVTTGQRPGAEPIQLQLPRVSASRAHCLDDPETALRSGRGHDDRDRQDGRHRRACGPGRLRCVPHTGSRAGARSRCPISSGTRRSRADRSSCRADTRRRTRHSNGSATRRTTRSSGTRSRRSSRRSTTIRLRCSWRGRNAFEPSIGRSTFRRRSPGRDIIFSLWRWRPADQRPGAHAMTRITSRFAMLIATAAVLPLVDVWRRVVVVAQDGNAAIGTRGQPQRRDARRPTRSISTSATTSTSSRRWAPSSEARTSSAGSRTESSRTTSSTFPNSAS